MFPLIRCFLIISFLSFFCHALDTPFWKKKTAAFDKMKDEHLVVVSARNQSFAPHQDRFTVAAGGLMRAPSEFVLETIRNWNALPQVVPYINEAQFQGSNQSLFIHSSIVGKHLKLTMKMKDFESKKAKGVDFEIVDGDLLGMVGRISVEPLDARLTEVGLQAEYIADKIIIPASLISFGLEFAVQRVCGQMRSHIETSWKNRLKASK